MSNITKKMAERATEMLDMFERRKRGEKEFVVLKRDAPEWMQDIIYTVQGDLPSDDYTYEFVKDAISLIADNEGEDIDELVSEIEPDSYTSSLTAWLDSSGYKVYYLTEALQVYRNFEDGFQLLATAQQMERQEVARSVIEDLEKL